MTVKTICFFCRGSFSEPTLAMSAAIIDRPIRRKLTNLGVRALVESCKSTLTSVDISDCRGLNDEVRLAVLAGVFEI